MFFCIWCASGKLPPKVVAFFIFVVYENVISDTNTNVCRCAHLLPSVGFNSIEKVKMLCVTRTLVLCFSLPGTAYLY